MKPPVDRKAALFTTLAAAFVVSACVTIYVTHVEHYPQFGFGGATTAGAPANPAK